MEWKATFDPARRPILFSMVTIVAFVLMGIVANAVLKSETSLPILSRMMFVDALFTAYVLILITRLSWWRETGFVQFTSPAKLLACLPMLFLPAIVFTSGGFKPATTAQMLSIALYIFMVAFAEEGLLRGVVLRALLPLGTKQAVLLSSALFGLSHLINLTAGRPLSATVVQVIYATLGGIGLSSARLYAGTIWFGILLHFLLDFLGIASRGFALTTSAPITLSESIGPIVITGIFALYGWQLLPRKQVMPTRE